MSSAEVDDSCSDDSCQVGTPEGSPLVVPLVSSHALAKRERLRQSLEKHVFPGSTVVVEGVELPEFDIASGLDDDSDTSCEVTYDGYLLWTCANYQVEVRPEDSNSYRVRVIHKPFLQIRNAGCVDGRELRAICRYLEVNAFEDAMRILFARYFGGPNDGKLRDQVALTNVVSESWVRSTYSAFEP